MESSRRYPIYQPIIAILFVSLVCFVLSYKNCFLILKGNRANGPKTVLVTGAAGFIGFHVSLHLAKTPGNVVVAMDNFNEYYDVQLKIDRAYELYKAGVKVYYADLCDTVFLNKLFATYKFTHVVHLGAQAGVRYSLENPLAYVHSNLEGTQAVLDVVTKYPQIHLIYASSSSVYGKHSSIPFHLAADTDHPGNIYAATKRANELMAYQHCMTTGVKSIGLRFFTVYGPWGRPDMAVYKFAQSIVEGKKVPVFKVSGTKELGRDFTYIDDIVTGVLNAMDYDPGSCGMVFNLGFGHSVSVPKLISILEQELGQNAELDNLPLPPTEILQTFADISISRQQLGYNPETDIQDGVRKFVEWFRWYHQLRDNLNKSSKQSAAQQWYQESVYQTRTMHNIPNNDC